MRERRKLLKKFLLDDRNEAAINDDLEEGGYVTLNRTGASIQGKDTKLKFIELSNDGRELNIFVDSKELS